MESITPTLQQKFRQTLRLSRLPRSLPAQVLAFRVSHSNQLAVVDLDESYAPKSAPTLFGGRDGLPLPANVSGFEDPRLFVHRGGLYVLAHGFKRELDADGTEQLLGWQFLGRLERQREAADNAADGARSGGVSVGPAGFRMARSWRLLLPEDMRQRLKLAFPKDISKPGDEKNWVPFVYEDSIHFMFCINPPVVVRVPPGFAAAAGGSEDLRTEFVSAGSNATARWRYGPMRGGSPALYDAALGGYVSFFHSHIKFPVHTTFWRGVLSYYMGCYVFAAQPPFGIQLMSERPLVGPSWYNDTWANIQKRRVIWPAGVIALPNEFVVSYGRDDETMHAVRLDRRKLTDSLQPPLPKNWKGSPC